MIFSSVDLPEPLRPRTPILAPGKNEGDVFQDFPLRRNNFAQPMHGEDVLSHGMKTWNETVNRGASPALRCKNAYLRAAACLGPVPGLEWMRAGPTPQRSTSEDW
jgi:hypothetical protein